MKLRSTAKDALDRYEMLFLNGSRECSFRKNVPEFVVSDKKYGPFKKGDRFEISLLVKRLAMRSGDFYCLGGIADRSGLLWYETKISKPLSVATSKGVGQLAMECDWQVVQRD